MDCSQDLLELDSEISRINILKESDPLLPVLPSLDIPEEPLADALTTPPVTPLHSPHAFLKEERWLFSPPSVMPGIPTHSEVKSSSNSSDTTENLTPDHTVREKDSTALKKRAAHPKSLTLPSEEHPPRKRIKLNTVAGHLDSSIQGTSKPYTSIGIEHVGVHPILLIRPVTLPVGSKPSIWHPPSLLQIVSHPTPDLVRQLTTSQMLYVSPPACQIPRK